MQKFLLQISEKVACGGNILSNAQKKECFFWEGYPEINATSGLMQIFFSF